MRLIVPNRDLCTSRLLSVPHTTGHTYVDPHQNPREVGTPDHFYFISHNVPFLSQRVQI